MYLFIYFYSFLHQKRPIHLRIGHYNYMLFFNHFSFNSLTLLITFNVTLHYNIEQKYFYT